MLQTLSESKGSLLDNYELIQTLEETKNKSIEICNNDPYIPIELITLYKNHSHEFIDNKFIKMQCDIQEIFKNKI